MNLYSVSYLDTTTKLLNRCYVLAESFEDAKNVTEKNVSSFTGIVVVNIELMASESQTTLKDPMFRQHPTTKGE